MSKCELVTIQRQPGCLYMVDSSRHHWERSQ